MLATARILVCGDHRRGVLVLRAAPDRGRAANRARAGAGFLLVAVPLLLPRRQPDWRELWLGSAFLLVAFAHLNIAWSAAPFDEPLLWAMSCSPSHGDPLVGAIRENAALIRSQTALSDRLHRHHESTEVMLDGLPVVVLSLDRQLRVRYANRSASSLLGVARGVTVGDPDLEWLDRFPQPTAAASGPPSRDHRPPCRGLGRRRPRG